MSPLAIAQRVRMCSRLLARSVVGSTTPPPLNEISELRCIEKGAAPAEPGVPLPNMFAWSKCGWICGSTT
jgi:hypothetical protein